MKRMKGKTAFGLLAILLCVSLAMGGFASTSFVGAEVSGEGAAEAQAENDEIPAYLDVRLSYKERAADLISRMSLEEKQAQLIPSAPAIPRLGVSAYKYQNEALHGLMSNDGGTSFPSPITTASSWNLDLMQEVGTIVSDEIRAYYNAAGGRGLSYYSPTMNLLRDPRWGRNEEAYSEDPFLTAVMGEQFVRGLQGIGDGHVNNNKDSAEYGHDYIKVAPTLKHYAANSSEKNRNSGTYDIDNKTLRDYYTWAFQRIVEKTDVASLMSAYNRINGVPCSANGYLLDTLLRKTFGFTGFVVNDCGAINDTILNHKWIPEGYDHVVTPAEAVALSLKAGNNMDCGGGSMDTVYDDYTVAAVEQGLITEAEIDQILLDIFVTRFKTGEFDGVDGTMGAYTKEEGYEWFNPSKYSGGTTLPESAANVQKSVEAGMQGAVLLKNENNALPIANTADSIKVFGPLMNCWDLGDYSGWPKSERITFKKGMQLVGAEKGQTVEFYDGMTANVPDNTNNLLRVRAIGFYPGAGIVDASSGAEFYNLSKANDGYLTNIKDNSYVKFENVDLTKMSAEEVRVFSASGNNIKVNAEFHLDSPNGTILATVQCLPTGNDLYSGTLPTAFGDITAANWKTAGFSSKVSSEQGAYNEAFAISKFNRSLWDFARGENNGLHDIYVTFSYDRSPIMNTAQLDQASHGGVSVVYIGTATANARDENDKATFGAYRVCNEASDRPNIKFPAGQEVLVNEVAKRTKAAGGKTVVVIQSVGVMDVSAFEENVDAIVWTAYNGMRQGEAHARILFGDYNPGGHLTQTWYKDDSQLYSYPDEFLWDYAIDNRDGQSGRTYMYFDGTPRYVFGYGLSYTNFKIDNMKVSGPADGIITVTADVTNTGKVDGADVVQVYVKAPDAGNGTVPKQELKGFARVELKAGETKQATIQIELKDLMAIDPASTGDDGFEAGRRVLMPGTYEIVAAYDSATPAASKTVTLTGSEVPLQMKVVTLTNDKVVALPGETLGSEVSVCLTDETFLEPGKNGLSVTYTSSNPNVATVNAATGDITAVGGGTSLITATFTLNGQKMEASYPVSVPNMPCLSSLSINGEEMESFSYNQFNYTIELSPSETTAIPKLTWVASENFQVNYKPTAKIPGVSVIEVTKGTETATYEFRFIYDPVFDNGVSETVATLDKFASSRFPLYATSSSNNMYADWTDLDDGAVNLSGHPNSENLYLTFTMVWHATDETKPLSNYSFTNGANAIRFRSEDVANKPGSPTDSNPPSLTEHNFGWRINQNWANEMHWGENVIKIPLGTVMQNPSPETNRDTPTSNYKVNVNGVDIETNECHLGLLDWSAVRRVILMVWPGGVSAGNEVTLKLKDAKIVDASVELETASLRTMLEQMFKDKLERGEYEEEPYNAYLAAYEKAEKVNDIAAWPSPLKSMIIELQTAINALGDDVPVNRTTLFVAVEVANMLDADDYTWESWIELMQTLAEAEEVLADANATQEAIETAVASMRDAMERLELIPVITMGDVNEDGDINSTDARLVLQYCVGKIGDSEMNAEAANVDGDYSVTSSDARLILQYSVGKISAFPAG